MSEWMEHVTGVQPNRRLWITQRYCFQTGRRHKTPARVAATTAPATTAPATTAPATTAPATTAPVTRAPATTAPATTAPATMTAVGAPSVARVVVVTLEYGQASNKYR